MYVIIVHMVIYVTVLQVYKPIKYLLVEKMLVYGVGERLYVTFCNDKL